MKIFCVTIFIINVIFSLDIQSQSKLEKADSLKDLSYYQDAIILYKAVSDSLLKNNNLSHAAPVLSNIGLAYLYLYDLENACIYLKKSLQLSVPDDTVNHVEILRKLGLYYDYANLPDSALMMHHNALKLVEKSYPDLRLKVLKSIGDVYYYQYSDYLNAKNFYVQALSLSDSFDDSNFLAHLYYTLASVLIEIGDIEKAQSYAQKALLLFKNFDLLNRSQCYSIIANSWYISSEYRIAVEYNQLAIKLVKYNPELCRNIGLLYNNLGNCFLQLEKLDSAEYYTTKAIDYIHRYNLNNFDLSISYQTLGEIYLQKENYESSLQYFKKCEKLKLQLFRFNHTETALLYFHIGNLFLKQDLIENSLKYYQKGISSLTGHKEETKSSYGDNPSIKEINNYKVYYSILMKKGAALTKLYNTTADLKVLDLAINTYYRMDQALHQNKLRIEQENSLINYAEEFKHCYESAIDLTYRKYLIAPTDSIINLAFHFMENMKSLTLWHAVNKAKVKNNLNIPDSLFLIESKIDGQIAYYNAQLEHTNHAEEINQIQIQLADLYTKKEALNMQFKNKYPEFYTLKYNFEPVKITKKLNQNRELGILSFFYGNDHLYGIYRNKNKLNFYKKPVEHINDLINVVTNCIFNNNNILNKSAYEQFCRASSKIYLYLFSDDITIPKNLLVIPDGPLSFLPLEVLLTESVHYDQINYKELPYLIKKVNIHYAFSFKTYEKDSVNASKNRFTGFSYTDKTDSQFFLEESLNEIEYLSDIFKGDFFINEPFVKEKFISESGSADVLHLALHASADTLNPLESKLVFANFNSEDEKALYTYELYGLNLTSRLTVLNACETGSGKYATGEGIMSLAKGFLYCGSKCVMTHLYKIDDKSVKDITLSFYRFLQQNNYPDVALMKAKINYLNNADEFLAHPYYWSSSILLGNTYQLINLKQRYQLNGFLIVLLLLLSGFLLFALKRFRITAGHTSFTTLL